MSSKDTSFTNETSSLSSDPISAISPSSNDTGNVEPTPISPTFVQQTSLGPASINPTAAQISVPSSAAQNIDSPVQTTASDDQTAAPASTTGPYVGGNTLTPTVLDATSTSVDINASQTEAGPTSTITQSQTTTEVAAIPKSPALTTEAPSATANSLSPSLLPASETAPGDPGVLSPGVFAGLAVPSDQSQPAATTSASDALPTPSNVPDPSTFTPTPSFESTTSQGPFSSSASIPTASINVPLNTITSFLAFSSSSSFHTSTIPAPTSARPSAAATLSPASGKHINGPEIVGIAVGATLFLVAIGVGISVWWRMKGRYKRVSEDFEQSLGRDNLKPIGNS